MKSTKSSNIKKRDKNSNSEKPLKAQKPAKRLRISTSTNVESQDTNLSLANEEFKEHDHESIDDQKSSIDFDGSSNVDLSEVVDYEVDTDEISNDHVSTDQQQNIIVSSEYDRTIKITINHNPHLRAEAYIPLNAKQPESYSIRELRDPSITETLCVNHENLVVQILPMLLVEALPLLERAARSHAEQLMGWVDCDGKPLKHPKSVASYRMFNERDFSPNTWHIPITPKKKVGTFWQYGGCSDST